MSNEKPLHQKSAQGKISRGQFHSVEHLACTAAVQNSQKFSFSVVCVRQFLSRVDSALGTFLAAPPSCPELHTSSWRVPGIGGALARLRRRALRRVHHRNGRQEAELRRNAVRRLPNPLVAPRGLLRASARMRHRRRGAARTERALCRLRARTTPFRRARP